jgi:histidinol-phosphate aminotransferase
MAPMRISRRDLLRRTAVGVALSGVVPSLFEGSLAAGPAVPRLGIGEGRRDFPIRLTSNCNAYGPSERVNAAMQAAIRAADLDPERKSDLLRDLIAGEHRVRREEVVLAGGSSRLLRMAVSGFVTAGKALITAAPTFDVASRYATSLNREVVSVPLTPDYAYDLDAMLSRCNSTTGLVYICNPNNPTGTLTHRRDLEAFIAKLPATTHVVIDEAYHHYVDDASDYRSFIDHPIRDSRVIVTRSFSKIHGLAPLRIGYAVASPEVAAKLEAHRTSEGISLIASSGAMAALADIDYVRASRIRNADDRQEFFNQANARMARWIDSQTNFVMLNADRPAEQVVAHFDSNQILLSRPYAGFEKNVRVSLGTSAEMREFWRVWDLMPGGHHMQGAPAGHL